MASVASAQQLVNPTSEPAHVEWINGGSATYYMTVAPGETRSLQSYVGHQWHFSNSQAVSGRGVTGENQVITLGAAGGRSWSSSSTGCRDATRRSRSSGPIAASSAPVAAATRFGQSGCSQLRPLGCWSTDWQWAVHVTRRRSPSLGRSSAEPRLRLGGWSAERRSTAARRYRADVFRSLRLPERQLGSLSHSAHYRRHRRRRFGDSRSRTKHRREHGARRSIRCAVPDRWPHRTLPASGRKLTGSVATAGSQAPGWFR